MLGVVPEKFDLKFKRLLNQKLGSNIKHKYFNAELLLISLNKWRQNNITESLFKIQKEYKEVLLI